jgi:hypothetical protein
MQEAIGRQVDFVVGVERSEQNGLNYFLKFWQCRPMSLLPQNG